MAPALGYMFTKFSDALKFPQGQWLTGFNSTVTFYKSTILPVLGKIADCSFPEPRSNACLAHGLNVTPGGTGEGVSAPKSIALFGKRLKCVFCPSNARGFSSNFYFSKVCSYAISLEHLIFSCDWPQYLIYLCMMHKSSALQKKFLCWAHLKAGTLSAVLSFLVPSSY